VDRAPGVIFGGPTLADEAAADVAGLYDPATNRWTVTSKAPIGPLNAPSAVWTGQRVILASITRGHPKLELAGYDRPATRGRGSTRRSARSTRRWGW